MATVSRIDLMSGERIGERMLKGKGGFVAAVAALVLAGGASVLLPLFGERKGLPSVSNATSLEGTPSHPYATERAVSPRWRASGAQRRERLAPPPSGPPLDIGERLDADHGAAVESIKSGGDPVSIGRETDVDDPIAYQPGGSTSPPRNLGALVDANDPGWAPTEGGQIIGVLLDADAPLGREAEQFVLPTVEIGELMDAGRPRPR